MYGINFDGLRERPTYDKLIDYVMNKQEKIKYPDRTAKLLRNSPQLSNLLDGDGEGLLDKDDFNKKQVVANQIASTIREMAQNGYGSVQEINAVRPQINGDGHSVLTEIHRMDEDDSDNEFIGDISSEIFERDKMEVEKKEKAPSLVRQMLDEVYKKSTEQVYEKLKNN